MPCWPKIITDIWKDCNAFTCKVRQLKKKPWRSRQYNLWNFGTYLSVSKTEHPRRLTYSATPLWWPQISQQKTNLYKFMWSLSKGNRIHFFNDMNSTWHINIIHSFSSLSYDRSKASSKASSPHSAIQSFLLQMRVSSPFLNVIQ